MEGSESNAGEHIAENTQQPTHTEAYSPEFIEKMESTQRALGTGTEGSNTYGGGVEASSFNIEEARAASQAQAPAPAVNPLEEGIATATAPAAEAPVTEVPAAEAPVVAPQAPAENNLETGQDGGAAAAPEVSVSSEMTGEINFGAEPEVEAPPVSFDLSEQFNKFLTEGEYGITGENISTELPKLIQQSKDFDDMSKTMDGYKAVFEKMPAELYGAIQAWNKGEDYMASINNATKFDLGKNFEDHGVTPMVDVYFEGKVTPEEWAEHKNPDGDQGIKDKVDTLIDLAKEKYSVDQGKHQLQVQNYERNAQVDLENQQKAFDISRNSLPERFKESFPIKEEYIAQVDKLAQDRNAVLGLFYNPDGSLKPDGHIRLAMATGGEELVLSQAAALKSKLMSQAREEVIRNAPDSTEIRTASGQGMSEMELAQQKAQKRAEELVGKPQKQTY